MFDSRAEAAKAANASKGAFESWVYGKSIPSFESLVQLTSSVNVSLDWLALGEGSQKRISLDEQNDLDIGNRQINRPLIMRIYQEYKDLHAEYGFVEQEKETLKSILDYYDDLTVFPDDRIVENLLSTVMRWERQNLEKYKVKASKDN